jgi:Ankyrin repeats (3 copies)
MVFFLFWAAESVISSPVPIFLYWRGSKKRKWYRFEWLFLGLTFAGLIGILWRNPILFVCLALLWCAVCTAIFGWDWRTTAAPADARRATLVAVAVLILALLGSASASVVSKQQIFRSAMDHRYYRVARSLVAIGADPNGRDQFGQTALMTAAWNGVGDLEGVNALMSMGANVNLEQSGGFYGILPFGTALHVAAAAGRAEICESLLKGGAELNRRNERGSTPLTTALSHSSLNCVPVLLSYGADVNAADANGHTPLMLLMAFGPDDPVANGVFQELIAKGADPDAKDASGKTVEDWAMYYKHERFAQQLRLIRQSRGSGH